MEKQKQVNVYRMMEQKSDNNVGEHCVSRDEEKSQVIVYRMLERNEKNKVLPCSNQVPKKQMID